MIIFISIPACCPDVVTPHPFFLLFQRSHLSAPWHRTRNVGDADVKRHHYLTVTHVAPSYPPDNRSALPNFTAFRFFPPWFPPLSLYPFPCLKRRKKKFGGAHETRTLLAPSLRPSEAGGKVVQMKRLFKFEDMNPCSQDPHRGGGH